jgi:hypothetical protein
MQNELLWDVIRIALVFGPPMVLAPMVYRGVLRSLDRRYPLHAPTYRTARGAARVSAVAASEAAAGI